MLLTSLTLLYAFAAVAQQPSFGRVKGKDFSVQDFYPPPNQNQIKSLLTGAEAEPQAQGQFLIKKLRLETYRENGEREVVVNTPECLYDSAGRSASSAGPLQVQTADEKFFIAGEGFRWHQADSHLIISNQVRTTIRRDATNAPAATNQYFSVFADRFDYEAATSLAIYRGNVRVMDFADRDLRGWLLCGRLTVKLAGYSGYERLLAEDNVRIEQDAFSAAGDRVLYTAADERVELTGNATWRHGAREGRGEALVFNRRDNSFAVRKNVYVKLPREMAALPGLTGATPPTNAPVADDQFFEVRSDDLDSRGGVVVFRGNVRAVDAPNSLAPGKLLCERLQIDSEPGSDSFQRLTAEGKVLTEQAATRTTSERLLYTRNDELIELTGAPTWAMDQRRGSADLLVFDLKNNALRARGNGLLQMTRPAEARALFLLPGAGASANAPDTAAASRLEIVSEEYDLGPARIEFRRRVRAEDFSGETLRTRLTSGRLAVVLSAAQNEIEQVMAQDDVSIEQTGNGQPETDQARQQLTCDVFTARLNPATGQIENAVAERSVVITHGDNVGRGDKAVYQFAGDRAVVELTGEPVAQTPEFILTGADVLSWDLTANTLHGKGPCHMKSLEKKTAPASASQPSGLR